MSVRTVLVLLVLLSVGLAAKSNGAAAGLMTGEEARAFRDRCHRLSTSDERGVLFGVINFYSSGNEDIGVHAHTPVRLLFSSNPRTDAENQRPVCTTAIVSLPDPEQSNKRYFLAPIDPSRRWKWLAVEWLPTSAGGTTFSTYRGNSSWPIYETRYSSHSSPLLTLSGLYYGTLVAGIDDHANESIIHWRFARRIELKPNYETGQYVSNVNEFAGPPEISSMYGRAVRSDQQGSPGLSAITNLFLPADRATASRLLTAALQVLSETQEDREAMTDAWELLRQARTVEEADPGAALELYNRAVDIAPSYYDAYRMRGELLKKSGNPAAVLKNVLEWASHAKQWRPEPFEQLVNLLIRSEQIEEAEKILRENQLASVFYAASQAVSAMRDYTWALELRRAAAELNTEDFTIAATQEALADSIESLESTARIQEHWMNYLKSIQDHGQDVNWDVRPYDHFSARLRLRRE